MSDTGGVVQDAVVADAAADELTKSKRGGGRMQPGDACLNCGAELHGPYCWNCGQVADRFHRPVWDLVGETLGNFFSIDGRMARTLPLLVFTPGRLTRNYLEGKRARYVPPFRLLIFATLAFFLLVALPTPGFLSDDDPSVNADPAPIEAMEDSAALLAEDGRQRLGRLLIQCDIRDAVLPERPNPLCPAARESARQMAEDGVEDAPDGIDIGLDETFANWPISWRAFASEKVERAVADPQAYWAAVLAWAPRIVIVLFPIYALVLGLLHINRRGVYLFDHLVVSMNYHSFIFTTFLISAIALPFIGGWVVLFLLIFTKWGIYDLHRRAYGNGRIMAILRILVLDVIYFFLLVFALLGALALGVTAL